MRDGPLPLITSRATSLWTGRRAGGERGWERISKRCRSHLTGVAKPKKRRKVDVTVEIVRQKKDFVQMSPKPPDGVQLKFDGTKKRTTLLCPTRIKYCQADYDYQPAFTPVTTADGNPCKLCIRDGRLCHIHRRKACNQLNN